MRVVDSIRLDKLASFLITTSMQVSRLRDILSLKKFVDTVDDHNWQQPVWPVWPNGLTSLGAIAGMAGANRSDRWVRPVQKKSKCN